MPSSRRPQDRVAVRSRAVSTLWLSTSRLLGDLLNCDAIASTTQLAEVYTAISDKEKPLNGPMQWPRQTVGAVKKCIAHLESLLFVRGTLPRPCADCTRLINLGVSNESYVASSRVRVCAIVVGEEGLACCATDTVGGRGLVEMERSLPRDSRADRAKITESAGGHPTGTECS